MSPAKAKEYLWAELGAVVGAVLGMPVAVGVLLLGARGLRFESLENFGRVVFIGLNVGVGIMMVGGTFGCWLALRRIRYPAARKVARILFLLLVVTYVAAFASTGPGFDFQYEDVPAKFLPLGTLVPLAMPLLAVWITGVAPSSLKIHALALLLVGLGAFVFFANPNDFFPPEPDVTPMVVEEEPAPIQLPVGRANPCWAGTYPDELAFLEAEEVPVRVFFVDLETNDIYYSDCVGRRLSQGDSWPPGVAERLVRSSDL